MKTINCSCSLVLFFAFTANAAPGRKLDLAKGWGVNEATEMIALCPKAARPVLPIPRISKGPTIDGKANDAAWNNASVIDFFIACKGFNSKPPLRFGVDEMVGKTWAKLCYDDSNFYVYVYAHEEHVGWLQKSVQNRDGSTWKDDCIELFFDRNRDRKTQVHAIINPAGTLYDAFEGVKGSGKEWNFSGEKIAVDVGDDYWALEMSFPLKSLGGAPKTGEVWGFNLCRQRRASSQVAIWAYGTWSGNPEGFQEPELEGEIVFGDFASKAAVPPEPFFGESEFGFSISNHSAKPSVLTASVEIVSETNKRFSKPVSLSVPAGQTSNAAVSFRIEDEGLQYATLIVKQGDEPILVQRRGLYIRPISKTLSAIRPRAEKLMAKAEGAEFKDSIGKYLQDLNQVQQEVDSFKTRLTGSKSAPANYAAWLKLHEKANGFSGQSTYVVWSKSPYLPTSSNDFPAVMEDVNKISLNVASNEWEHAALMISNLTDEPLNIIVKGNPTGLVDVRAPLATDSTTVVAENPDALGYETVRGFNLPGKYGEPLVRLGQLREVVLMPLSTRQLFLTFHAADLKPGSRNTGALTLYTLNKNYGPKKVQIDLNVYPFEIPTEAELGVHCYDYSSQDFQLKDIRAHKVNTLFAADNSKFTLKDGVFAHDMDKAAKKSKEKLRFGGQKGWAYGLCIAYHKWAQGVGLKPGEGKYDEYWRKAVRDLVDAHRKAGFKDGDYYIGAWDEVKHKDVETCVHLLRLLKEEAPHIKVANTIQCSKKEQQQLMPYVDAWVAAGGFYWDLKFAEELRKAGKELWSYTCKTPVRGMESLSYYRMAGWRAARMRMKGISFFAWSYLVHQIDNEIVPTRNWEAWRAGVEDWQIWNRLQKEIARVETSGKKEEAAKGRAVETEVMDDLFANGPYPRDEELLEQKMSAARDRFAAEIGRLMRVK